jgi:predicted O-linked N-acetylglucosamine transferase (SPINDLY family)
LNDLKQHQAAVESFNSAVFLRPGYEFLHGTRLHTKMCICDWTDAGIQIKELARKVECAEKACPPFPFSALDTSPALQRKAAEVWANEKAPFNAELGDIAKRRRGQKIRIGYFSMDFGNHPVALLTAGLFESHDRSQFEVYAFSFGFEKTGEIRSRLEAAFDMFIDVKDKSDREIAMLARQMNIDIAIDLAGFTSGSRTGIFAMRCAPIQVNYLGYPGTMGAHYIDYLVADKTLIPQASQKHYCEKIVYLPDTYMANDSKRPISDKNFTREELGLPQAGFVFCCFNNNYKITPETFDGWMRILSQVEGSVLWLSENNSVASSNLRKEAQQRGVNPQRLVFAQKLPLLGEHLARHRAADLFIDTLPFNAHTTASDALWAGLPVLTCTGEAFASRVAASLLNAIGVPELITSRQEDYEALAIELASQPEKLKAIRQKLQRNRLTTPLFDTALFTRNLEQAYAQMFERYQAGLQPQHMQVSTTRQSDSAITP